MSVGKHSHSGDAADVNARKVINKIKRKAETSGALPSKIVTEAVANATRSAKAELPNNDLLKKTVRRHRKRTNPKLKTPSNLDEMYIPEIFQKTLDDKQFLFYDNEGHKNRYLIFTTEDDLNRLSNCSTWLSDGTFSVVPSVFQQIYTIHGVLERENNDTQKKEFKAVPLVYILTPKKNERIYTKVLKQICKDRMKPNLFITDFERAFINSVQNVLPDTTLHGCLFHYSQCIMRHLKMSGFQVEFNTNDEFALHIKMIIALAFVPLNKVVQAYEILMSLEFFQSHAHELAEFLQYYKSTWIGEQRRNGRDSALFPIELWNCYSSVLNQEPRTNNNCEAWHNAFATRIGKSHEQLGTFINALKVEQGNSDAAFEQHNCGRSVAPPKRKKYINYEARLLTLVQSWDDNCDVAEYLRGIAHSVK